MTDTVPHTSPTKGPLTEARAARGDSARVPLELPPTLFGKALGWYARRRFGEVPDSVLAVLHNRPVLTAVVGFERRVEKWDSLDAHLKDLAVLGAAGVVGCSWCLDFGWFISHSEGRDTSAFGVVATWREHQDQFTAVELLVLEYAEAMTLTPPTVTDDLADELRRHLGDAAFIELTMIVAVENQRSRFNSALGLTSQGYTDTCELAGA